MHSATEGPAYFATFLDAHGVPWQVAVLHAAADRLYSEWIKGLVA